MSTSTYIPGARRAQTGGGGSGAAYYKQCMKYVTR